MSRFFLGFLAVAALALVIGHSIGENPLQQEWKIADNSATDNGGVMIIETYSASSIPISDNNENMKPLPGNKGVEVAPNNNTVAPASQPIMVEEDDMLVQENE